nr:hypothetical protein [Streptomyces sp. Ag82_O1-15]
MPVTGADPDAVAPWLATAFVPGPSLEEAVARHGPLPVRSVRVPARMLAAALRMHAAGLVQRDVKSVNVLLAVDGPRLIDFGIARVTDATAITSTDLVVGTPGFLSPEQAEARGAAPGHRRPLVRDAGAPRHRADRRRSTGGRGRRRPAGGGCSWSPARRCSWRRAEPRPGPPCATRTTRGHRLRGPAAGPSGCRRT